jgi:molybdopterin converting factor small subunit
MTRVVLPGVLRAHAGGAAALDVALPEGATLADLLTAIEVEHPALVRRIRDEQGELRRFVNVYVDGTEARSSGAATAPVGPHAEVLVLPSIAGG